MAADCVWTNAGIDKDSWNKKSNITDNIIQSRQMEKQAELCLIIQ